MQAILHCGSAGLGLLTGLLLVLGCQWKRKQVTFPATTVHGLGSGTHQEMNGNIDLLFTSNFSPKCFRSSMSSSFSRTLLEIIISTAITQR